MTDDPTGAELLAHLEALDPRPLRRLYEQDWSDLCPGDDAPMVVHDVPCGECKHFSAEGHALGLCGLHRMWVTKSMRVTHFPDRGPAQGGLCFEGLSHRGAQSAARADALEGAFFGGDGRGGLTPLLRPSFTAGGWRDPDWDAEDE